MSCNNQNPVITVVRDRLHSLGKKFTINDDGSLSKKSNVLLSFGIAKQYQVLTHEALRSLLESVGNDPHGAIINASFPGIEIGEEFIILSGGEFEKRLNLKSRDKQIGVHSLEYEGKTYKAVGRFKENTRPSNWQLADRDQDQHTPEAFAGLSTSEWLAEIAKILPGLDQVTYIELPSTSSRVLRDGVPVGQGNSHVWFYVDNPDDMERARVAFMVRAMELEMTWSKPRFSRSEPDKVIGQSQVTLLDTSVWTVGRLSFEGQPTVGDDLEINPPNIVIHKGSQNSLDTSALTLPDSKRIREITAKAGTPMRVRSDEKGLKITAQDLTLETEIETKEHGVLTVRELVKNGIKSPIRCQTPFRASESWAGMLNVNQDGIPFVYDHGTSTTHWLNEFEQDDVKLIPAQNIVEQLIPKVKEDSAAVLEEEALKALAVIRQHSPADYQRNRAAIKSANKEVSLAAVDRSVKACQAEMATAETHHGYAKSTLAQLTEDPWKPVGHHSALYVLNPDTHLWDRLPADKLIRQVAEMHDAKENCCRSSDYRAIAEHAISLAADEHFFTDVPNGLACKGGFYQILGDELKLVPLAPEHRQRVMLNFTPAQLPIPMFEKFLHETFESSNEGEEAQQIVLVQEMAGAIMLGILYKYQVAVLFFEPFGRAGKGTLEKILRGLVPHDFISAVSPFKWDQDYHVATLAGKRLNVVGELPEQQAIPASAFKSVLGCDLVTGRHPTHRPITFSNEAAHLFMSNHLITTKDQSEAFFARWKIIEFPNSRLRSGLPLDKNLAERIIDNELPGIAYWALEGAMRLLKNSSFSASAAHDRLMAKWRRTTNTLEEFIHESCDLAEGNTYRRSDFYADYTAWCTENGRRPFGKGRVKELLEHNIGMGIRLVELHGYETFKGVQKKAAPTPARSKSAPKPPSKPSIPLGDEDITKVPDMPGDVF